MKLEDVSLSLYIRRTKLNSETCLERPLLWKTTLFVRPLDNVTTLKVVSSSKTSVYTCGLGGQGVEVVILFCFNLPPNIESFLWKKFLTFPLKKRHYIFPIRLFRIMSIPTTFRLFLVLTFEQIGRELPVFTLLLWQHQHISRRCGRL